MASYVQLMRGQLALTAKQWDLSLNERWAFEQFLEMVDWRTAEISPITRTAIAEELDVSRNTAKVVMDRLAECGLAVSMFTPGGPGWLVVPVYLEHVWPRSDKATASVAANVDRRLSEWAAVRAKTQRTDPPPVRATTARYTALTARTNEAQFAQNPSERAGETPGEARSGEKRSSSSYAVGVGVGGSSPPRDEEGRDEAAIAAVTGHPHGEDSPAERSPLSLLPLSPAVRAELSDDDEEQGQGFADASRAYLSTGTEDPFP